jgi:hypothetical protein
VGELRTLVSAGSYIVPVAFPSPSSGEEEAYNAGQDLGSSGEVESPWAS